MKVVLTLSFVGVIAFTIATAAVYAEGGKVRGDKAVGPAMQLGPTPALTD